MQVFTTSQFNDINAVIIPGKTAKAPTLLVGVINNRQNANNYLGVLSH